MTSAAVAASADDTLRPTSDERVLLHGVSWSRYCLLRELLDSPGVRLAYLEGALEIMSPSPEHEFLKKIIARLVEAWSEEVNVPLQGYGSTTFRREAKERGLEPDECYCVGSTLSDSPDIALEVVLTSGGLNKLSIYAGLGVREVWFWRRNRFEIHLRQAEGYQPSPRSALVPDLDFEVLATFVRKSDQHEAVKAYRAHLRQRDA